MAPSSPSNDVDDLLEEEGASHVDATKIADTVDIHAVCERAMERVKGALRQPLPIETDFASVPPAVAREAELFQVLVNVLLSAEEVGTKDESGPPRVFCVSRAAHGRVILEVHAGGATSGAVSQSGDGATTSVSPAELGLNVCENILRAVGGDLALERRGDRGLAFRITLEARGMTPAPKRRITRELFAVREPESAIKKREPSE
jgi:C4-dicarboxylate-specific signal transduction histidine kinase